jgi:hypothetical protein
MSPESSSESLKTKGSTDYTEKSHAKTQRRKGKTDGLFTTKAQRTRSLEGKGFKGARLASNNVTQKHIVFLPGPQNLRALCVSVVKFGSCLLLCGFAPLREIFCALRSGSPVMCNLRILNSVFGVTYPRLMAAQSARLACTRARCARKSADAWMSESGSTPSAAFSAAAVILSAVGSTPRSDDSVPLAR